MVPLDWPTSHSKAHPLQWYRVTSWVTTTQLGLQTLCLDIQGLPDLGEPPTDLKRMLGCKASEALEAQGVDS